MLPILGIIGDVASSWIKGKADEAKAKQEVKIKAIQQEGDWEKIMASGSQNSWKDEWFTIVLSIPLVFSFYPEAVPYIAQGFEALQKTPEWYQWAIMAAISASFGLRGISKFTGGK